MQRKELPNVRIVDNGAAFLISVDGIAVSAHNSLGGAWRHIEWMHAVASQCFTVGERKMHIKEWLKHMYDNGCLDEQRMYSD